MRVAISDLSGAARPLKKNSGVWDRPPPFTPELHMIALCCSYTCNTRPHPPTPRRTASLKLIAFTSLMSAAFALSAISAYAQEIRPSRVVEWNCPLIGDPAQPPPPDPGPGALVADDRFVWFVTRFAQPRLVRFQRGQRLSDGSETNGTCNWWDLELDSVQVGGLRLRPYGLQAFIRTFTNLQRIETDLNRRTSWTDGSESFSDVAVRKYDTKTYVYTTGVVP